MDCLDEKILLSLYRAARDFAGAIAGPETAADDLVQDAAVRIIRRGGFAGVHNPEAYLNVAQARVTRFDAPSG